MHRHMSTSTSIAELRRTVDVRQYDIDFVYNDKIFSLKGFKHVLPRKRGGGTGDVIAICRRGTTTEVVVLAAFERVETAIVEQASLNCQLWEIVADKYGSSAVETAE